MNGQRSCGIEVTFDGEACVDNVSVNALGCDVTMTTQVGCNNQGFAFCCVTGFGLQKHVADGAADCFVSVTFGGGVERQFNVSIPEQCPGGPPVIVLYPDGGVADASGDGGLSWSAD